MYSAILFLLLAVLPAQPAITGPSEIVPAGKAVWLEVEGIAKQELMSGGEVNVFPRGVIAREEIRVLQDPHDDSLLIWFCPDKVGLYDVQVVAPSLAEEIDNTTGEVSYVAKLKSLVWTIQVGNPLPPDPPDPILPPSQVTKAMLILETGAQDKALGLIIEQLRDLAPRSLTILDKDTKDENRLPDPEVQQALVYLAGKPLPQLVGFSSEGPVAAEALPATAREAADLLARWGVK